MADARQGQAVLFPRDQDTPTPPARQETASVPNAPLATRAHNAPILKEPRELAAQQARQFGADDDRARGGHPRLGLGREVGHAGLGYAACIRRCIEPPAHDAVTAAKDAIWRLFEAGLIDEDLATLALLAIALGIRRGQGGPEPDAGGHDVPAG